jgi:hypothetical protein
MHTHMHTHTHADGGFVVVTADRIYYFVAEDSADKFEWIQVFGRKPQH